MTVEYINVKNMRHELSPLRKIGPRSVSLKNGPASLSRWLSTLLVRTLANTLATPVLVGLERDRLRHKRPLVPHQVSEVLITSHLHHYNYT